MSLRQSQDQRSAPTRVLFLFPQGYIHKPRDISTSQRNIRIWATLHTQWKNGHLLQLPEANEKVIHETEKM